MERRKFITQTGIISAALMFPLSKLFGQNLIDEDETKTWKELIEYARWCPSPHNVQPWKMKLISKTEAHLYYDPARLLPIVDPTTGFTILGLAMFIESLNIAANPTGYKIIAEHDAEPQLDFTAKNFKFFAKLYLVPASEKDTIDRELIKNRKTSRLHFDGRIIEPDIIKALTDVVRNYGSEFYYSADKELINDVINLNSVASLDGFSNDAIRNELGKWIRTTDKQAEEKKDGLWNRCMVLPGKLMRNFFFHHERFQSKLKRKILYNSLCKSAKGTINIAWINGQFENRNDWLKAGTMLQRLWLEMTKHNVYLHPFGAIINQPEAFKIFTQRINYEENKGNLWFLIRLGYSKEPARSLRLETKDILIS